MNRNLLSFFVCAIIFGGILVCSCKEEEDTDLIIGKWRLTEVVESSSSTPCDLQSHIEFSDYVFNASKRQMLDVVVKYDALVPVTNSDGDTIGFDHKCKSPTVTAHKYTISNDTLTIDNATTHVIKQYIIVKIDKNDMVWKSLTLNTFLNYTRWE